MPSGVSSLSFLLFLLRFLDGALVFDLGLALDFWVYPLFGYGTL